MMSRNYEIKKQVIGDDPDLEKTGRILNRVIEWGRETASRLRRIRDTSGRCSRILNWIKRITQRLHATWTRIMRTMQEAMEARERTNVNKWQRQTKHDCDDAGDVDEQSADDK